MPVSHARFNPFDSRQLMTAIALARTRSFTEAARQLGVTQSAVSHSLKALENELGEPLFNRKGRQVSPTHNGEQFLQEASEILHRMQAMRERLVRRDTWSGGRLRVGAEPPCAHYLLPQVIREFRQSFPRCTLSVMTSPRNELIEAFKQGELDLLISLDGAVTKHSREVEWFVDELSVMMPPYHPLARLETVRAADLQNESIHLLGNDELTDALVKGLFIENGISVREFLQVGAVELVKEMTKLGQGIALQPSWVAAVEISEGSLVSKQLADTNLQRKWTVSLPERQLNLVEETFLGLCLDAESSIFEDRALVY